MADSASIELVTVHYERKYSDGNYGSEGVSLTTVFGASDFDGNVDLELTSLRRLALEFLVKSASWTVAQAAQRELEPPKVEPEPELEPPSMEDLPY